MARTESRATNTVIHEVMHLILNLPVADEAKVVAVSGVVQLRTRK